jgi:polysaccharide biosynthesis transport protein
VRANGVVMANSAQIYTPGPGAVDADGLSARALLQSLRRHWAVVAAAVVLFALAGAAVGLGLPPRYKASGTLVIYSQPLQVSDVQEVLPDQATDMAAIASQVDVLRSRSVIEDVVRSLALWRYPEFQAGSGFPGGWSPQTLEANVRGLFGIEDAYSPPTEAASAEPSAAGAKPPAPWQIDEAVGKYGGHLAVDNDGQSMTINVSFTAWTTELAARIVNAHMQTYRDLQQHDKAIAAQHANAWLNAEIAKLRRQLQPAEAAVSLYRVQHHLTGTAEERGALSGQLASLTSELIAARADLAESEARAAEIGVRASGKGAAEGPEAIDSPTVQALRAQEATLIESEAALATHFGPAYPELQNVRSSLRDLRGQIVHATSRSYAAALELVDRSRAREQSIERSVDALTKEVNSSDAGLRQLQEKADSIRSLLARFEKRMEETAAEPAFITSNSTIVTRADPLAVGKVSVVYYLSIGAGFVGFVAGALLALLLDLRDRTFQTSTQVAQHLEPRIIGTTPRAIGRARQSPADLVLDDHRSAFAEALRVSWTNIHLTLHGAEVPGSGGTIVRAYGSHRLGAVLGVTSAGSGEGKSMHALALARTAAVAGESVVLVDADRRRSGVSRLIEQRPDTNLNDFLRGRCGPEEVVAVEPRSGMHFVASAPTESTWTSSDFRRFGELIGHLKERFAVVIVDLPPLLGLAETVRLATATNGVVFVVRWGHTDRDLVRHAFDALGAVGVTTTTIILNDVDMRAQRRRSYRDPASLAYYSVYGKNYA